ncbi:MAG: VOC family protein [Alphaproteobacteria bacterium]|nr:VOC family protein [Alphaproteobacteria bacterium]MCB9929140.1 VOC family protein [Alphaproteobacteria bacterium]
MTIEVLGLLHTGFRVGPTDADVAKAHAFYGDLLGLQTDEKRPEIRGIPGFWSNVRPGDRSQQLHIMGAEGASPVARSDKQDPTRTHVAFAVADLDAARAELEQRQIEFWEYKSLVGTASDQIFFEDPFGNMIELQQG